MSLVTILSCFKKFLGDFHTIQHSALYSWWSNHIPAIVPDNEVGIKEHCSRYPNVIIINGVRRGWEIGLHTGAVIVPDLIDTALPLINTPLVAFISSDIVVPEDFSDRLGQIIKRAGFEAFLYATRHNVKLSYRVDSVEAYEKIQHESWALKKESSPDVLILSKYWLKVMRRDIPEFIIGRGYWKEWIYKWACCNILKREDCTFALPVLHCDHDNRLIFLQEGVWGSNAPSFRYNQKLWEMFEKNSENKAGKLESDDIRSENA